MKLTQLNDTLGRVFTEEKARIVFWNDPEGEFLEALPDLELAGVKVVRLDEVGALEAKIRLERDDPCGQYLLYAPTEEPDFDDDWLLDIRLYSRSFRADRASIILDELGLAHQSMRQHINERRKFFDNKERVHKLKQLVSPADDEVTLDRKMLAVVTRAEQSEPFNILHTIFDSMAQTDEVDLDEPPLAWSQIEKFELDRSFWKLVRDAFGYEEESPSLRNLLIRLFVADFARHLDAEIPDALQSLVLPGSGAANAVVCLAQWRDSASKAVSYNRISDAVGERIYLDTYLTRFEIEQLIDVMSFFAVEKAIVRELLQRVSGTADVIDKDNVRGIVGRRQAGHWVSSVSVPEGMRLARHAVYEAVAVAADLFALRNRYSSVFDYGSAKEMYAAYEKDLYRFDQLYRRFCEHADLAEEHGWHMLKPLRGEVEAVYCNYYLTEMGQAWGRFVDADLLDNWRIEGIANQYKFFSRHVRPRLEEAENRKVFVIISDAFRYEVAEELARDLNGKYRFEAELFSQLGVLPSYTTLGMASLLPHKTLEYTPKGEVLADGKPTASLAQRSDVLSAVDGMAIKAEELISLRKEEGRERVAEYRVVYVYHNEIDARGDSASTESGTFDAARDAIAQVASIVKYIVNSLSGNYVLVTADHGFLFTETPPDETDKSRLIAKPAGTVIAKKRYLLGHRLGGNDAAWHGRTERTAGAGGDMEFWIPRAGNRFHFVGGARFVHGGAMPQEIVVPIIRVRQARGAKRKEQTRTRQVTVQVLGTSHRITAQKHRFKLVQMEAVSDRIKAAQLKIAVYDGDQPVTSIETVKFDSASGDLDERQTDVILTLEDRVYDKRKPYRLVLRDAETGIEQQAVDVTIDRAFTDDFDF